jgi:hypothetical protein
LRYPIQRQKYRVFAIDFPCVIKEELTFGPSTAAKKAMDTLKPAVVDTREAHEFKLRRLSSRPRKA